MFIMALRGPVGLKLNVIFHLLVITSGGLLYYATYNALEILICTVVFISYYSLVQYMRAHRGKMKYSHPNFEFYAFPDTQKANKLLAIWYLVLVMFFLAPPLILLLFEASLDDPNLPDIIVQLGFWLFYYCGSWALVGFMNYVQQKKELV